MFTNSIFLGRDTSINNQRTRLEILFCYKTLLENGKHLTLLTFSKKSFCGKSKIEVFGRYDKTRDKISNGD